MQLTMKRIRKNIRWAAYFARFCPTWRSESRQDKRAAISQFIQRDTHGIEPAQPHPLLSWIVGGKQWYTHHRNELRAKWCTPQWEGFAADRNTMPAWLFSDLYSFLPTQLLSIT